MIAVYGLLGDLAAVVGQNEVRRVRISLDVFDIYIVIFLFRSSKSLCLCRSGGYLILGGSSCVLLFFSNFPGLLCLLCFFFGFLFCFFCLFLCLLSYRKCCIVMVISHNCASGYVSFIPEITSYIIYTCFSYARA